MPTSTRLRGNKNPILTFKKGSATAVNLADDLKSYELTSEDGDEGDLTFYEASLGLTAQFTLSLTGVVSFQAGSLWRYLFDNPGSDVAVVFGPQGNATPSATEPHFTFTVNTGRKPGLANEARTTKEGAEFTAELLVDGDVTMKVS